MPAHEAGTPSMVLSRARCGETEAHVVRDPAAVRCPQHRVEPLAHLVQHGRPVAVRNTDQVGLGERCPPSSVTSDGSGVGRRKSGVESTSKPLASRRSAYSSAVGKDHGFRSSASITASGFRSAAAPECRRGRREEVGRFWLAVVVPASAAPRVCKSRCFGKHLFDGILRCARLQPVVGLRAQRVLPVHSTCPRTAAPGGHGIGGYRSWSVWSLTNHQPSVLRLTRLTSSPSPVATTNTRSWRRRVR